MRCQRLAVLVFTAVFAGCAQPRQSPRAAFETTWQQLSAADYHAALPAFGEEAILEFRPKYVQSGRSTTEKAERSEHSNYEMLVEAAPGILELDLELLCAEPSGEAASLLVRSRSTRNLPLLRFSLLWREGRWQFVSVEPIGMLEDL